MIRSALGLLAQGCLSACLLTSCDAEAPEIAELSAPDAGNTAPVSSGWHAVFEDLDSLVLAGWAASDDDAFFVGGQGQVLRYRSSQWTQLEVPTHTTLWWVWGTSASNVYVGGEEGTLLHFDGSTWSGVDVGLDPMQTIWGIWGASDTDIWLVGGAVRSNGPGFVLRGDGQNFERQDLGAAVPNLFKVWGSSKDEVYAVGDRGVVLHFASGELETQYLDPNADGGITQSLFTVAGNASGDLIAVGGVSSGLVFEKKGSTWEFEDLQTPGLNGVVVAESGEAYAVGLDGTIRHRVLSPDNSGQWLNEDYAQDRHYHSAVLMGDVVFAVGGDLLSAKADRRGLIAASGNVRGGEITWVPQVIPGTLDAGQPDATVAVPGQDAAVPDAGSEQSHDSGIVELPADAGSEDSGVSEPLPGPSELCTAELECNAASECWLIQGENENRCVTPCATAAECPPEYGPNPQCAVPGCQTLYTVCMPEGWNGCF